MTRFPQASMAANLGWMLLLSSGALAQGATLDELLKAGLERNPELLVLRQEAATVAVDTLDAATAINPHLEVEASHNLSAPENPAASVRLSREVNPGIRGRRKRTAKADVEARKGALAAAEQGVAESIRTAYYEWQVFHRKEGLQREVEERWEKLAASSARQMAQGKLSELDLGEARLNALKAAQSRMALQAERASLEQRLRVLTGLAGAPAPLEDAWADTLPALPALDTLLERARRGSPQLEARRKETQASRLRVDLEERKARPPVNVFVGYEREPEGDHMIGGGVELPLAFFDRNQAGTARARSALREGELRESAAAAHLRSEIQASHGRLAALADRYTRYRKEIRDLIRKQMSLSEKGFQQGMLGVFDLSRVQEEFLAQEGESLDLLAAYYRELSRMEAMVGGNP